MRARILAVLAALAATLGLVSVASPAQAGPPTAAQIAAVQAALPPGATLIPPTAAALSTVHGCHDELLCLFDSTAQFSNNSPTRVFGVASLLNQGNGVALNSAAINFDNKTTCATNNSRALTGYAVAGFAQFNSLSDPGFYWEIPSGGYSICWNGWWRDNRASRIWSYHRSSASAAITSRTVLASAPVQGTALAEPSFHTCAVGDVCGFRYHNFVDRITHYHATTIDARAGHTVYYSGAANRISSYANWTGKSIIFCTNGTGGDCFLVEPWHTGNLYGSRDNNIETVSIAH
jgi:hypothetical protein